MATARKESAAEPAPAPVTIPVIPPDEAFYADLEAKEDAALAQETVLEKDLIVRQENFDKIIASLVEQHDAEMAAVRDQKARQANIRMGCQAARASLKNQGNVVPMATKAADDGAPIPQFLRQPSEVAPAA